MDKAKNIQLEEQQKQTETFMSNRNSTSEEKIVASDAAISQLNGI